MCMVHSRLERKFWHHLLYMKVKKNDDLSRLCLNRDFAWVLTSAVEQQVSIAEKIEPLESWKVFMK